MTPQDTFAVDQILAVLNDAREPMTARQIGEVVALPSHFTCDGVDGDEGVPCFEVHGWAPRVWDFNCAIHVPGVGDVAFPKATIGVWITPHLKQLQKAGQVSRSKEGRSVVWRRCGSRGGINLAAFERMLLLELPD